MLAIFRITRQNFADCDPIFLGRSRSLAIGEQPIHGAEAELTDKLDAVVRAIQALGILDSSSSNPIFNSDLVRRTS
ncbi:MAG: hypothetical protein QM605_11760 [Sphingobium sp.]